jgi:hypothetical protein
VLIAPPLEHFRDEHSRDRPDDAWVGAVILCDDGAADFPDGVDRHGGTEQVLIPEPRRGHYLDARHVAGCVREAHAGSGAREEEVGCVRKGLSTILNTHRIVFVNTALYQCIPDNFPCPCFIVTAEKNRSQPL